MRKNKLVSLRLTQADLEQLADGAVLEDVIEEGIDLQIDLDESAEAFIQDIQGEQTLDLSGDQPTIPPNLEDLNYQRELLPLAAEYDVIERTGSRQAEDIREELRNIRQSQEQA